jgi:hypothetical protein
MFSCSIISSAAGFGTHHCRRPAAAAAPWPAAGVSFVLTGTTVCVFDNADDEQ